MDDYDDPPQEVKPTTEGSLFFLCEYIVVFNFTHITI